MKPEEIMRWLLDSVYFDSNEEAYYPDCDFTAIIEEIKNYLGE